MKTITCIATMVLTLTFANAQIANTKISTKVQTKKINKNVALKGSNVIKVKGAATASKRLDLSSSGTLRLKELPTISASKEQLNRAFKKSWKITPKKLRTPGLSIGFKGNNLNNRIELISYKEAGKKKYPLYLARVGFGRSKVGAEYRLTIKYRVKSRQFARPKGSLMGLIDFNSTNIRRTYRYEVEKQKPNDDHYTMSVVLSAENTYGFGFRLSGIFGTKDDINKKLIYDEYTPLLTMRLLSIQVDEL